MNLRHCVLFLGLLLPVGCVSAVPGSVTPRGEEAELVKGPSMTEIVTDFDSALSCLRGKMPERLAFAVANVNDTTGKEQYADGGTGKLVSQGAGDMVQSALFKAKLTVVNRRDPNIPLAENSWGIRNIRTQVPADLFVSGSINSLDFIPGGGAKLGLAGVGPRYRQNRILVGLDLALTDANTGRIVSNVSIQKQIFADEIGFDATRFFGTTLVEADVGGMRREALQFTLRQMLSWATFELIAQTLDQGTVAPCRALVSSMDAVAGPLSTTGSASGLSDILKSADEAAADRTKAKAAEEAALQPGAQPVVPAILSTSVPAPAAAEDQPGSTESPPEALKLAADATAYAARVIMAGDAAAKAETAEAAAKAAADAEGYLGLAVKALQAAANAGLRGSEGDAAAVLVRQAVAVAQEARRLANEKAGAAPPAGANAVLGTGTEAQTPENTPGTGGDAGTSKPVDDKKLGGSGIPTP
jgi:curli biogenesis system outer membrane secretion channel CsgG